MKLTKRLGMMLVGAGLILQAVDVITTRGMEGGAIFGPTGVLRSVDRIVPKVRLPGTQIETNVAFWVILAGVLIWILAKRR